MTALPQFPDTSPLALEHAPVIRRGLSCLPGGLSEYAFANLYLFRRVHAYRVSRWRGFLVLQAKGYDGAPYLFPPLGDGDLGAAAAELLRTFPEQRVPPLFPVSRELLDRHFSTPVWAAESDRDQADYLYAREDLANLPGKKFHKRKNRLNKLLRDLESGYRFEPLADTHLHECLDLADGWCEIRCSVEKPSTYLETEAVKEALELRRPLGLSGGVIVTSGRVRAFCLGEPLDDTTYAVHFEKAEPGMEGLAQLINRDFCLHELAGYRTVNREQDLGDPGLRQAKEAYHPLRLLEKYRVRPA